MRRSMLILPLLLFAAPALAVDGVLEINQTCAVQTGCFPGDSPGYPVFIDGQAGGSYRLTSNLIVPNENTDGILFNTSDIGIDLNNFAIIGAGCVGSVTNCTPTSGTGSGIERTSSLNRGVSVKNGSITGMGRFGVFIGDQAHITNISVRWNGEDGINTSSSSTVSGNTAYQNGRHGINVFTGSTVSGNTVSLNGDDGIRASAGSTVSENTVYQNAAAGIEASSGSIVSGNAVRMNGTIGGAETAGIETRDGTTVSGNTVSNHEGDGIRAFNGCVVQGNSSLDNARYGMVLGISGSGYRNNVITDNTMGTVSGGVNAGGNICNGSLTCP
jgi:parallel beta-helix repeat protein